MTAVSSFYQWLPRGSSSAVVVRAASAAIVLLSSIVWARALEPAEFGAYSLAFATVGVVGAFGLIGLDQVTSRELGVLFHRRDWSHVRGFLRWARRVSATASVGVAGVAAVVIWANPMGWDPTARDATLWIIMAVPALALLRVTRGAFQAADRTARGLFWELTFFNGLVMMAGAVVLISRAPVTATTPVVVYVIAAAIAAILAAVAFTRIAIPAANPLTDHKAAWIRAGVGFAFFVAASSLMQQADILVLGAIATTHEVGLYSVASRGAGIVLIVMAPVTQVLGPRLAQAWNSGDRPASAAIARRAAELSLVAAGGMVFLYLVLAETFLGLFGPAYVDAAGTLRILAVAQASVLLMGPGAMALVMTGRERIAALLQISALLAGLPLGYVLYGLFGIQGMAGGKLVVLAGAGVLTGLWGYRRIGIRIDPWSGAVAAAARVASR